MELTREQIAAVAEAKRADYEAVIGLEVHVQLKTTSKIFCACSARFGDPPNTNVCPVCLGLPGALPVLNRRAAELAILAALALNCRVNPRSRFARKNYFYPDLPKGYQISQYEEPLSEHGWLEIETNAQPRFHRGQRRRVGITRVHLEEDAGKSLHEGFPDSHEKTYLDFNRCGVPLIEIVSEPDLRAPAEAYEYLTRLKQILQYIDVSDCDMEKGSLRCDANVSVRRRGVEKFGVKTEVKNLNSFRYLARALTYEIDRHVAVLEEGGTIEQETRLWNLAAGRTDPMRSKEFAHDYRYFPEPDLVPLLVDEAWKAAILRRMPELPAARRARLVRDFGITEYDAEVLTATRALADYFEAAARDFTDPKKVANVISNWVLAELRNKDITIEQFAERVPPEQLVSVLRLMSAEVPTAGPSISATMTREVIGQMAETGCRADEIIAAEKMEQITGPAIIEKLCREVLAKHSREVEQYKKGKEALFGFFVGQAMKASRGQANPQRVNETLKRLLSSK